MKRLSHSQILLFHQELIDHFGGVQGIRDEGLLDSALNAPFQTFAGDDLYPSFLEKGAKLGYGLVSNHPFIDGNKRIGTLAMMTFLRINGLSFTYSQEELINVILDVASGTLSCNELYQWLANHLDP
ncbi:type II toxin-antitoxin system death-on-curing family toxin [Schaalia sp. lx-100]|uniref:type II toxin-antitoxin system death-on-curing family toxin n=1 Tax=Schaalia sp. lx-100 TaxID=2899081 RepID=UPI001E433625|nr:type II toxin-antitoxin system death-on-curing family toxin [Schaalia sp. lx-100]MCD4557648.1 type II toxin-antitoxin system death-on-curing family toxin [Schaalia sp. lx-100]